MSTRKSNRRVTIATSVEAVGNSSKSRRSLAGVTPQSETLPLNDVEDNSQEGDEQEDNHLNGSSQESFARTKDYDRNINRPSETLPPISVPKNRHTIGTRMSTGGVRSTAKLPFPGLSPDIRPLTSRISTPLGVSGRLIRPTSIGRSDDNLLPSLANFSDSEAENDDGPSSPATLKMTSNLLGLRKRSSRVPTNRAGGGMHANIVSQVHYDDRPPSANSGSYNWISLSIVVVSCIFFVSIFSYYLLNSYHESRNHQISSGVPRVTISPEELERQRQVEAEAQLISKLDIPLCSQILLHRHDNSLCIQSESDIKPALMVIQEIRSMFEERILKHYCDSDGCDSSESPEVLKINEIRDRIVPRLLKSSEFTTSKAAVESGDGGEQTLSRIIKALNDAITLIQLNPSRFKMTAYPDAFSKDTISILKINSSTFPVSWPLGCRLRLGFWNAMFNLAVVLGVLGVSFAIYLVVTARRLKQKEEQHLFTELLEKSLELLHSPDEPGSMPVIHIRDTVISPSDRQDHPSILKIWEKVVKHIEESESRVKVAWEEIEGETFKTWKWVCPVSLDGTSFSPSSSSSPSSTAGILKTGSIVWQGTAFNDRPPITNIPSPFSGRSTTRSSRASFGAFSPSSSRNTGASENVDFVAPTAFLKVRNMFDEEIVASSKATGDSYWKVRIMNAIMEKCQLRANEIGGRTHGLCHIFVDESHSSEGLVYIKCQDIPSASSAYLSLHGWWCQSKLVSVRFLKDEKYYSRFPEARGMKTPLQPEPLVDID